MSCQQCKTILERLNSLEKTVEDMVLANNAMITRIANNIELKIDILSNVDQVVNNQKKATSSKKPKAKAQFFKELFKTKQAEYNNILYSNDDIAKYMNLDEIKQKKEEHKISKVSEFIYKDIGKDATKLRKLNEVYEEYKQKFILSLENNEPADANDEDDEMPDLED